MEGHALFLLAVKASLLLTGFAAGLETAPRDLTYLLRHPSLLLRSLLSMYVIMPALTVAVTFALHLSGPVTLTLVLLSISPLPALLLSSAKRAHARSEYLASLLALVSVASAITVPTAVALINRYTTLPLHVPEGVVLKQVGIVVLLPLLAGATVFRMAPALATRFASPLSKLAMGLLLLGVLPILGKTLPLLGDLFGDGTVIAMIVISALGLLVGHVLGGHNLPDRMVLALATVSRHPGIAVALATTAYPDNRQIPLIVILAVLMRLLATGVHVKATGATKAPPRPEARPSAGHVHGKFHFPGLRHRR